MFRAKRGNSSRRERFEPPMKVADALGALPTITLCFVHTQTFLSTLPFRFVRRTNAIMITEYALLYV
jgi:hypothetical protein